MVKNPPARAGEEGSILGLRRSPGGGNGKPQTTPIFLPGKSHGQRSLVAYSPWDCNESDMTEQLNTHTQGKQASSKPIALKINDCFQFSRSVMSDSFFASP